MLHIIAATLALSDPSAVVETSIADVLADPERFGGQTLRMRGQVDACYGFVCSICPEDMTPATEEYRRCLRISFDSFMSEEDRAGPSDARYRPVVSRGMEEAFRFSVITAEGVFDPSCLTRRPWPPEEPVDDIQDEVLCTDRATTWSGLQVRAVHRRLMSNDGLVLDGRYGSLTLASADISTEVQAAYRADVALYDDRPITEAMAVLVAEEASFKPAGQEAHLCLSKVDDAPEWPRREMSVWAKTPNDPYYCYVALKNGDGWRVFSD
ncbi:hypothetical protein [Brevundimonas lenta]|uniref:Uncharacterized protein n=1 Tax=Brevundimonas lenta TaxID=424796 RepID=A0A7W6NPC7_9CAUL|nr:hypothetical protein [Brevundimonas lenta]MBB4082384.1 hypothetical protein [Brevundimonas lenta]